MDLADALARRFQRRFPDLIQLDDARRVARHELIRAAACVKPGYATAVFLKLLIQGVLQHCSHDHGRLVRFSRREHGRVSIPRQNAALASSAGAARRNTPGSHPQGR